MTDNTTGPATDVTPARARDTVRDGRRRRLRRILPPLVASMLTALLVAPLTWHLATRTTPPDEPPLPSGPVTREALQEYLVAQLPDRNVPGALLVTPRIEQTTTLGLPPARYRLDLVCGQLRRQGSRVDEVQIHLRTAQDYLIATVPCPSTVLSLPELVDFSDVPAGAVMIDIYSGGGVINTMVVLHFVPVEATATGGGDA